MTPAEAARRVKEIRTVSQYDEEAAYMREVSLSKDFIKHIADSYNGELAVIAKEVCKSYKIHFNRWCA